MTAKPVFATRTKPAQHCPRCNGTSLSPNPDDDLSCNTCGNVVYRRPQANLSLVPPPAPAALSQRQQEAVRHLAAGLTNRQIAQEMGIVLLTVKQYIRQAKDRLGFDSRRELVTWARKLGGG